MFLKKKDIHCSDSINQAIESLRQALEVYLGHPIRFRSETDITRGKIVKYNIGSGSRRTVPIVGTFLSIISHRPAGRTNFDAEIDLECNSIGEWKLIRAHVDIKPEGQDKYETRLHAHNNNGDVDFPELRVAKDMPGMTGIPHWWIGYAFDSRHQVPFYGDPKDCECGGPNCGLLMQIWSGPSEIPEVGKFYTFHFYKKGLGGTICDPARVEVAKYTETTDRDGSRGYIIEGTAYYDAQPGRSVTITNPQSKAIGPCGKVVLGSL